jgi:dynein heavy chain 2
LQVDERFEALVLLKSMRTNTLSKLTYADARRFEELCNDVYPGITVKDIEYAELEADIRISLKEMKLNVIESQITKMIQFHEACQQRMGVGIVGPSGCGKSTIWQVLAHAYGKARERNPNT